MSTSPTLLTRFYGIELHYAPANDDDPPYLRAVYGDESALFDLYTCEIVSGALPRRAEGARPHAEPLAECVDGT